MAETEYADFSDMQNPELPDLVEEQKSDSNLSIGYEENTRLEETPEKETQEVKPEPETSKKEDPSQNPYWQSKYDREVVAARQEAERLKQEIESIKGQLNPPKKDEPLVPPTPPRSDDPVEEIRYAREYAEYVNKVNEQRYGKMDAYFQTIEAERQAHKQQELIAQQRAWQVSQLAQSGLSPEEANQALADFSRDAETPDKYFKDLAEFWKFRNGQQSKPSKIEQRANRKYELPPLGAETSELGTQQVDPNDAFYNDMQGFIKRNY
jgi:hypothetical protein